MGEGLCSSGKYLDNKPLCSVCIANYNGETYLEQCIDSILAQEHFPGSIEIIVHDDASTDGSVAFIQSRYPQVRLLTSTENVGFCISNNRMVAVAKGTFILLLNNDAALHKDALKALYGASIQYGDGIFGLPQYDADTGELIDIGSTFDLFLNPIPNKDITCQDVGMIIGACLWLPRSLWDTLGGFPDWFGSMAEDMHICSVARLCGYSVKALSHSGFDHWVGRSFGGGKVTKTNKLSTTISRRALSERNKTFVMLTCYPGGMAFFVFPIHLFVFVVEGIMLALVKQEKRLWVRIYWNCIVEVWKKRSELYQRRRSVQKVRKCSLQSFFQVFSVFPHKMRMLMKFGLPKINV